MKLNPDPRMAIDEVYEAALDVATSLTRHHFTEHLPVNDVLERLGERSAEGEAVLVDAAKLARLIEIFHGYRLVVD